MAYDGGLAQRIREVLQEQQNVVEKKNVWRDCIYGERQHVLRCGKRYN